MLLLSEHALIALLWLLPAIGTPALPRHWWLAQASAAAGALAAALLMAAKGIQPALLFQLLIQLLAWVILRFSVRYLSGEQGQARYLKAIGWLLVGSTLVVASRDWPTLLGGWLLTSRALHSLLTFYPSRPQAGIAARREAVASRLAELCLLLGALLIAWAVGSLHFADAAQPLTEPLRQAARALGAVLVVCCVLLKTAQLPFHGWLTQVMEAPTPVSALLHAGVVNLGGLVLIKLAPLWSVAPATAWLLTLWGGITAGLACWVMQTRISIKLRLAWSTCAQMGFMLMECGLGQYSLALLHLVAHSIYKAHAFLSSGSQVRTTIRQSASAQASGAWRHLASGIAGIALLLASLQAWSYALAHPVQPPLLLVVVIGLGLAPLCQRLRGYVLALALCQAYLLLHSLFARLQTDHAGAPLSCQVLVALFFAALYLLQGWLVRHPGHRLSQRLYALAFGGLYLDEWWVRATMRSRLAMPGNPALSGAQGGPRS
nr:NADH-quinone oxidoreductase subunit L [uncultured Pseudogulbenkiania sp.]